MEIQYVLDVHKHLLFLFRVFEKSLQYVKRFSRYKNPDAVRQVREYPQLLSRHQLAEFELCVLGNLCPETVEEAIAMVPS
ncbi:DNA-directed RNA polymerase II subunit 4, partial [Tanacetum coccineum]